MALGESFPSVLEAARGGSDRAWTMLFRDLSPSVLAYLRVRGAAEPEDLTGEVFLQVARDLPRFSGGEGEFRAWVFVIAHHRLLDEVRYRKRHPSHPAAQGTLLGLGPTGDVEDEAMRALATDRVRAVLDGLSKTQRDVLMLRIVAGLTVEEVARALGKRPDSIKAIQRRGVGVLRKRLAQELPPSAPVRR